jgi:queuine tRNA-ribosyltransferase
MLGARLNTIHNLHYFHEVMAGLRQAIDDARLGEFRSRLRAGAV